MKKFLFVLLMQLPIALMCQDSLSNRIVDTIFDRSPNYYYDWWYDNGYYSNNDQALGSIEFQFTQTLWNYRRYLRYNDVGSKDSLKIIGLSVCGMTGVAYLTQAMLGEWYSNASFFDILYRKDTFNVPEYLYLYDATPDSIELKYKVEWHPSDSIRVMRITCADRSNHKPGCDAIMTYGDAYMPVYEVYFDSAITVTDSFYVGSSLNSWCIYETNPMNAPISSWDTMALPLFYNLNDYESQSDRACPPFPSFHYKLMDKVTNQWIDMNLPHYLMIMPIIEIDTTPAVPFECHAVSEFSLVDSADSGIVLQWIPSDNNASWDVSYCPSDCEPDSGMIVNVAEPHYNIESFDSCALYHAYVRAQCLNDSTYYSEWIGPLEFCRCDTTSPEPERIVVNDDGGLRLAPNPTSETVSITSDRAMDRISVIDGKGVSVLEIPVNGTTVSVSVKDLSRGIYYVRVVCDGSVITRRLVVN